MTYVSAEVGEQADQPPRSFDQSQQQCRSHRVLVGHLLGLEQLEHVADRIEQRGRERERGGEGDPGRHAAQSPTVPQRLSTRKIRTARIKRTT